MIIAYLFLNFGLYIFSVRQYKKKINPISIYIIIWSVTMTLYESKLLRFYQLKITTWIIIILMQLVFVIGCFLGLNKKYLATKSCNVDVSEQSSFEEKLLKKTIIVVSFVSAIAIITNVLMFIRIYGFNLLKATTEIYIDRVNQSLDLETIPYLGAFIYIAIILGGVYIKKYGFKRFIFIPVILIFINQLTTGGRGNLIIGLLMLSAPIITKTKKTSKFKSLLKGNSRIKLFIMVVCFVVLFIIISNNRSEGQIIDSYYASNFMIYISNGNASLYKVIVYMTAPIGVLNSFIESPTFNFGGHTFLTLYNFLNKLGYNITTSQYQEFYYVPMRCNVGTYIRELIQDFTIAGAILVTIILGYVSSKSFLQVIKRNSYAAEIRYATLFTVIVMSFFDWRIRSSTFWIILLFGTFIGMWLDRRIFTCKK